MNWRWRPPAAEAAYGQKEGATARGGAKPEEEMGKGSDLLARLCPHQWAVTTADASRCWQVCRYSPAPVYSVRPLSSCASSPLLRLHPLASPPQGPIPNQLVPKPFSAQAVPILPMTSYEPNFWATIATFCRELAPISGPLLDSISQTAAAIDRAGYGTRSLRAELDLDQQQLLPPEDGEEGY